MYSTFRLMKPLSIGKDVPLASVQLPVYASTKLDGIRACVQNGRALSNSGTELASIRIYQHLANPLFEGLDGEIVYSNPADEACYGLTSSAVNSIVFPKHLDWDQWRFCVFDLKTSANYTAEERYGILQERFKLIHDAGLTHVMLLEQEVLRTHDEIDDFYNRQLEAGYEGAIFKRLSGRYKMNRAGTKDQVMLRLKPFGNEFFEAQILSCHCAYENTNPVERSNLGYAKRSSHQDGMVPVDMLGYMTVRDTKSGVEFRLPASKMTHDERTRYWKVRDSLVGAYVRYTCMTYGEKDKPRMPSFRGFRDTSDFSPKGEF